MAQEKAQDYFICLDDDPTVLAILQGILQINGLPYVSGESLVRRAQQYLPYVAFVDIHLEDGESGLDVLPTLRTCWPHTPIIVMTADDNPDLIGQALSLGANDFIRKPFGPEEVRARVLARVMEQRSRFKENRVTFGDIVCDRAQRLLEGSLGKRHLSASEWELFSYLLQSPGLTVSKSELKGKVWGDLKVSDNAVDRKISTIRQALRDVSSEVRIVRAYGRGVSLTSQPGADGDESCDEN